jgi:enoyl-CoA hydratase/3-hydroxyacyl-CoA dehydrogenase
VYIKIISFNLSSNSIDNITVIGAGTMGHGIAQAFATSGFNVNLVDVSDQVLNTAFSRINDNLNKKVNENKFSSDIATSIINRITLFSNLQESVKNSDFVIEAIIENLDAKINVLRLADQNSPDHTIFASNTSALPITLMAESLTNKDKFIGFHWFNPPPDRELLEIIKCKYTSNEVIDTALDIVKKLNRRALMINSDIRGFIANRVYRAMRYEAILMFSQNIATVDEIDSAFRYKIGWRGPFELIDYAGAIDLEITESNGFDEVRRKLPDWEPDDDYVLYRKHALNVLQTYYDKGWFGVKAGKGFYEYPGPGKWVRPTVSEEDSNKVNPMDVLSPAINLSASLIHEKISNVEDIDLSIKIGYVVPRGILELADDFGIDNIVKILEQKKEYSTSQEYSNFYTPHPLLLKMIDNSETGKKSGKGFYNYS